MDHPSVDGTRVLPLADTDFEMIETQRDSFDQMRNQSQNRPVLQEHWPATQADSQLIVGEAWIDALKGQERTNQE